jgi:hypothetical protein
VWNRLHQLGHQQVCDQQHGGYSYQVQQGALPCERRQLHTFLDAMRGAAEIGKPLPSFNSSSSD